MDSVKWMNPLGLDSDDIMVSDSLLDFGKDEDLVNSLNIQDEILPQGRDNTITIIIYGIFFTTNSRAT